MRGLRGLIVGLLLCVGAAPALAQTSPNLSYGEVLTAGQWNALFAGKQDYLGSAPCLTSGCTFSGALITTPSTATAAGFNLPPGVAPTSPNNGDFWATNSGYFGRLSGVTVEFLTSNFSPVFNVPVEINLNSAALPNPQTGTLFQVGNANAVDTRIEIDAFAATARVSGMRSEGTAGSPSAVATGSEIASFNGGGYNGSAWVTAKAAFRTYAAPSGSTWTTGDNGTYADITATPAGATSEVEVLRVNATGTGGGNITVYNNGIGATSTDGEVLSNVTAATSLLQQWSPRLHWIGQGWKTASTAASEQVDFIHELQTFSGTSAPTGALSWSAQVNGAGYTALMALYTDGGLTIGSPTGGDKGAGTVNVSSGYYLNGASLPGTGTVTGGGGGIVPTTGGPTTLYQEQAGLAGRVTLESATCVATTDQAAQTVVYYAPCGGGKYVPIYDGTNMELHQFTSSDTDQVGLTLTLGSNWAANTIFDVFITLNSGVVVCTVPWSNSGAGTSSRATAITLYKGVWVNSAVMTCRTTNSATLTVAQYQGTLVGGFRTNASTGTVDLKFGTNASGGGTACICIWNVYNQVQAISAVGDTTATWTYSTATYQQSNASAGNQINVVQGLAGQPVDIRVLNFPYNSGTQNVYMNAGIGIDSTSTDSSQTNISGVNPGTSDRGVTATALYAGVLGVGYHNLVRLEQAQATGTTTWQGYSASNPPLQSGIRATIWY